MYCVNLVNVENVNSQGNFNWFAHLTIQATVWFCGWIVQIGCWYNYLKLVMKYQSIAITETQMNKK